MELYRQDISSFTKEDYDYWYALMSDKKQKRVASYKNDEDRIRSVCGHSLALRAISEHTPLSVEEIVISEDGDGKPFCENAEIYFSISHCDKMVVCAVSDKPVGVDVERIRKTNLRIAKRVCNEREWQYIFPHSSPDDESLPCDEDILKRFFEIWTKKEAFGKKEGFGIAYNMKEHDVTDLPCFYEDDYIIAVCE